MESLKSILDITSIFIIALILIISIGLILNVIQKNLSKYLYYSMGYFGYLITSIGTVIHELSHLIAVLLLGMKPTEVKLLRPYKGYKDGCLGYVSYAYNKKNWVHKCGLLFVGIAPIIGGTIVIFIIIKLIFPDTFSLISESIKSLAMNDELNISTFLITQIKLGFNVISDLLRITSIKKAIGVFLIFSISSHMSLSSADLDSAKKSILYILIVCILVGLFVNSLGLYIGEFIWVMKKVMICILLFCNLSIIFSLSCLIISYLINKILTNH